MKLTHLKWVADVAHGLKLLLNVLNQNFVHL